jgi:hypothetical protein
MGGVTWKRFESLEIFCEASKFVWGARAMAEAGEE